MRPIITLRSIATPAVANFQPLNSAGSFNRRPDDLWRSCHSFESRFLFRLVRWFGTSQLKCFLRTSIRLHHQQITVALGRFESDQPVGFRQFDQHDTFAGTAEVIDLVRRANHRPTIGGNRQNGFVRRQSDKRR